MRTMSETRPRGGWVQHRDGTETAVRFVPTEDPAVFLAVNIDGDPIELEFNESLLIDKLHPGQRVKVLVTPPAEGPVLDCPCRYCGAHKLRIEMRLEPWPSELEMFGLSNLMGMCRWPWMVCDGCGHAARGQMP